MLIHKVPIHYIMIGVWYAVTEIKITGPMYFALRP
jgi:hypothetical protein